MATTQGIKSNQVSQALLDSVNGKRDSSQSKVDAAQDRFMTLLVTQMKNQDPLNPMDNAEVTSQMAQLSTVTGIDKLNKTLESLIGSVQTGQSYQASSMIGHHVMVAGNSVGTNGDGGYFGVDLPSGADKLTVSIKDGAGNLIKTLNYGSQPSGPVSLDWNGLKDDGTKAPAGNYKFDVVASIGKNAVTATGLSYAKVMSITAAADGVKLNLSNSESVKTTDVKEIF